MNLVWLWAILCVHGFTWTAVSGRSEPFLHRVTNALWVSLLLLLLMSLLLGVAGLFSRLSLSVCSLVMCSGALVVRSRIVRKSIPDAGRAAGVVSLLLIVCTLLPAPGHWIRGGWDPGVYLNEGVALARTGGFVLDDQWFIDLFPDPVKKDVVRIVHHRAERFPGLALKGSHLHFEFFRLFPSGLGLFALGGGVELASRFNTFLSLVLLLTCSAMGSCFSKRSAWIFPVLLLGQTLFLYHSHVPVTEVLEAGLIFWAGFLLFAREPDRTLAGLLALIFLCGSLNRFTFLPIGGILFLLLGLGLLLEGRARRTRAVFAGFTVLAGVTAYVINRAIAPVSIVGWGKTELITGVFVAVLALMAGLSFLKVSDQGLRGIRSKTSRFVPLVLFLILSVGIALSWYRPRLWEMNDESLNFRRLVPFLGAGWIFLSVAGAACAGRIRNLHPRHFAWIGFLVLMTGLLLFRKNITGWYPWALRRYLPYLLPLMVVSAGFLFEAVQARLRSRTWVLAVFLLLLGIGMVPNHQTAIDAARFRDYPGLADELALAATQIPDEAIVVADDARWGTPLLLVHGKRMVDGKKLWRDKSGGLYQKVLTELADRTLPQVPVYFLTSLENGMELYPESEHLFEQVWQGEAFVTRELIHHPKASHFQLKEMGRTFALYRMVHSRANN